MNPREELEVLDRQWVENTGLHESVAHHSKLGTISWLVMMAGFGLVFLGLWMNDLGEDVRLERLLQPWMITSTVSGVCVVIGALVFMIRNGRHIREYNEARMSYEYRREELLQEIYAGESD